MILNVMRDAWCIKYEGPSWVQKERLVFLRAFVF